MQYRKKEMVQKSRVFGRWKVLGRRIHDMSLVEIGSLFASEMEGPNLQKSILKKNRDGSMAGNERKRCTFYVPFRIYNFYDACQGETISKIWKIAKKKQLIEAEIVNFLRVQRWSQVPNMKKFSSYNEK